MMIRALPFVSAIALLPLAGCPEATPSAPSYPPSTTLALAKSPRCAAGSSCTCRALDSDDGQSEKGIPAGHKRFELRLPRSTSAIWVAVDGKGHYYKPPHKVLPACFYIDLPLGEHSFTIRSDKKDPEVGLQTGLTIREYGHKEGPHWYRSFDFACGGMNKCTKKGLRAWIAFQRGLHKGVLNRCGSVKIKDVTASGTIKQKQDLEYEDLVVKFQLLIYKFEPYQDPNHPSCSKGSKSAS